MCVCVCMCVCIVDVSVSQMYCCGGFSFWIIWRDPTKKLDKIHPQNKKTMQNTHGQKLSGTLPTMQETSTMQNDHALTHTHTHTHTHRGIHFWDKKKLLPYNLSNKIIQNAEPPQNKLVTHRQCTHAHARTHAHTKLYETQMIEINDKL